MNQQDHNHDHALTIFNFQQHEIRTVLIDDEPWWVAKDVCNVLEIEKPENAYARLDEDEKKTITLSTGDGFYKSPTVIVNEPGLYNLIFASRKPQAKEFKRWVTHEVLPAIRKTGGYTLGHSQEHSQEHFIEHMDRLATSWIRFRKSMKALSLDPHSPEHTSQHTTEKPASNQQNRPKPNLEKEILRHLARRGPLTLAALRFSYMKRDNPFEIEAALHALVKADLVSVTKTSHSHRYAVRPQQQQA